MFARLTQIPLTTWMYVSKITPACLSYILAVYQSSRRYNLYWKQERRIRKEDREYMH
jgi:hypothetical protein